MVSDKPLVSVYICSHNYGRFLEQAILSVQAQLYQHWELFIVDDGSSDNTRDISLKYSRSNPDKIFSIQHDESHGLQKSANEVLRLAKGKYIVRLDADDWFDESALLALVTRAEMEDSPGIVYGSYYYVDEEGEIVGIEHQPKIWDEDRSGINPPHGACSLVKVRSLKSVGGYSEDIDAQDGWELWFKLLGRTSTAAVSTPVFFYRQHGGSLSVNAKRLYTARTKIFSKLRNRLSGSYVPTVAAVIPVRESYPHFANVPYAKIGNQSVLEKAISEAQNATGVSTVIVSADRPSVLEYCETLEKDRLVDSHFRVCRPESLNGNHIHLLEILLHAGEYLCSHEGVSPDIVLFLNLHAVRRTSTAISKAIDLLLVTEVDTVVSVVEERNPVFVHSQNGLKLIGNGRFDNLYHKGEQVFRYNGGIIGAWWDVFEQGSLWGARTGFLEMTESESTILSNPSDLLRFP